MHSSYASLGKDFKSTFDDLVKDLNEQQADNERLHQQILEANSALMDANNSTRGQLADVVAEEKQKSIEERQQLVLQLTSLINANAEAQEQRLTDRMSDINQGIGAATLAYETKQGAYSNGMDAWSTKSKDILTGISRSREGVKTKIKGDFAAATQHSTSLKDTTTSVHASTVKIVEEQVANMDTQLHSLDEIVSRVRAQNDAHHAAHTSSLSALSATVQSSYSSIGDHLSTSFTRVQSLEEDMDAQATALKDTLPTLSEDATIRAPLHELRDAVANQHLIEYKVTGETPAKIAYTIPSTLPRTEAHETLISRLRDRPATSDTTRSPSKQLIFNDATNSTSIAEDIFSASTAKPFFARSVSARPDLSASVGPSASIATGLSLRELDVNIVAQDALTSPLENATVPLAAGAPPLKKHNRGVENVDTKLPMKKMGRKTVAGGRIGSELDRENLSITSFANSIGPGARGQRKLRSQGSQ